ncbi:lysine--tRNA ligase [Wohlfahrtiimonas chitiniclastica]|uniref:lysine--tRNA ligase n=1 Tax=Wohlfahrtiimonas chitiniclastica TaxID=400946 RepID=UPI000B981995|nr:lysine--tRNA ligase [Wohlfahrtiimonas chitiniclastica]MBS7835083.1 lysine--tRNA ligase [Wohlfahrtiimonas chitiniclastica]OYQ76737.1 lysine--tRNA ligase [Wohlfahrtiimonas chitiniclastica]
MSQDIKTEEVNESHLITERREKLAAIRKEKPVAFPNHFRKDTHAKDLHKRAENMDKEALAEAAIHVKMAGRIMSKRLFGKGGFVVLRDQTGDIQLFLNTGLIGQEKFEEFTHWDIGDIIGVSGVVSRSDKGELTVRVSEIDLLTKSLRPLPDKFHGLTDIEARYRQRYVDLIVNMEAREVFRKRTQIMRTIRNFFDSKGFEEVETPMMHPIPGGANAKPFITHHNALDMEFYLRIAPELYLKRLVVGGMEKVYEVNRNFRNEGVSTRHNPEFTMVEWYWAYADYQDMMNFTDELMTTLAMEVTGSTEVPYQGLTLDFSKPATRMTVQESIIHYYPEAKSFDLDTREGVAQLATSIGIKFKDSDGWGKILMEIFDEKVEENLMQPTFITAYPSEVSPLARKNDANPLITDRFEYFIGGREVGNGYSELNDAEDQYQRFMAQVAEKDSGDDEAMHLDKDFITALEYGLPPTAGEGIGIDRLVMIFADVASIRDVLLFPHMRNRAE